MTLQVVKNARTRKEWAEIINADWRKSIEGIIQTGRDLTNAKSELAHGEFVVMVEEDLFFSADTAERLMKISRHPEITKSASSRILPPSWTVLSHLTRLSAQDFQAAKKLGLINPGLSQRAARAVASTYSDDDRDRPVGEGKSLNRLPSPKEANEIAEKTGRLVRANDGRLYTGATEQETDDFNRRRDQTYGIVDAINAIADCPVAPKKWATDAESYMLQSFRLGSVDAAIEWLKEARPVLAKKLKVHDAK